MVKAPYDARIIANSILRIADENGVPLSLLSLSKLLYFAHGEYLAHSGVPLIKQSFEAWENGPVCRLVWDAFKDQCLLISEGARATRFNPVSGTQEVIHEQPSGDDHSFVEEIVRNLARVPAFKLVEITHAPGSPWDVVWNGERKAVSLGLRIDNYQILAWFTRPQTEH
jgi:uncharacterized phage-associated protein